MDDVHAKGRDGVLGLHVDRLPDQQWEVAHADEQNDSDAFEQFDDDSFVLGELLGVEMDEQLFENLQYFVGRNAEDGGDDVSLAFVVQVQRHG